MIHKIISGDYEFPTPICQKMNNGMEIISVKDNSNPVLCIQLYIRTGSALENNQQRGYSHFIEHLSFKSTRDFPNNGISFYTSGLGGMLNAYTDYDCTCYYLNIPAEQIKEGLHILSQLAFHSTFNNEDAEKEKEIILEEIKQYQNEPESDFLEYIQKSYYLKSPLQYPVLGNPESIHNASFESLSQFYEKRYIPLNAFLIICGDFQEKELKTYIEDYFGDWQNTDNPLPYLSDIEPELNGFRYFFRKKQVSGDTLAIALPELSEKHPCANALLVAMRYLAIGKSSRLFIRLVEEEKICSSVKVNSLCGFFSGISVITFTPISENYIPTILDIFREEYSNLMNNGIPLAEMELIKKDIIYGWFYSFEGMENLANLVAMEKFTGDLNRLQKYGEEINSTTMENVMAAIHKYWLPEGIAVYVEGPSEIKETATKANLIKDFISNAYSLSDSAKNDSSELNFLPLNMEGSKKPTEINRIDDDYYQIFLSNGMQVLFKQLKHKNISGYSLSTPISQVCESPHSVGNNFFCSSLLLYQTQKHSHQDLLQYSRDNGLNIRLMHHLDSTTFRGKCLNKNLNKALSLLAELLYFPNFDRSYLSLLTSVALDDIRRDNDYPVSYAYLNWYKMLVGNNSNLFRSTGTSTQIRSIRLANLQDWYSKWNIAKDFCLCIAGNYSVNEIWELCEENLGGRKFVSPSLTFQPVYAPSPVHFKKKYRKTDQAIIYIGGFASPASDRDENTAFYVLAQILGGDISSRFFDLLREQYGYAYQTGFDFQSLNELGFWNAFAFCDKADYQNCLTLMQSILSSVVENGVTEDELKNAKQYLIGMNRFENESVSYTASTISNLAALGYEPEYYLTREERIRKVDSQLIWQIAKKWLLPENQFTYILL